MSSSLPSLSVPGSYGSATGSVRPPVRPGGHLFASDAIREAVRVWPERFGAFEGVQSYTATREGGLYYASGVRAETAADHAATARSLAVRGEVYLQERVPGPTLVKAGAVGVAYGLLGAAGEAADPTNYVPGGAAARGAGRAVEAAADLRRAAVPTGSLRVGEVGSYRELNRRRMTGDGLTPHHAPQVAQRFTSHGDGGAVVMNADDHAFTRTYRGAGKQIVRQEAGLPFRTILGRDMRDLRQFGEKYRQGTRDLIQWWRVNYPDLMKKTTETQR